MRFSSAGSIATPKKKKKKANQSNSALSKYPSPKVVEHSIISSEEAFSPHTPGDRVLVVQSMMSDYKKTTTN